MALTKVIGAGLGGTNDLTVDTTTLTVDATNNRVGVGTASPSEVLHVNSGSGNIGIRVESTDSLALAAFKDNSTSDVVLAGASGDNLAVSHNILFTNASKGVYLGVTSATASNLLDDYEEGTWTPQLTDLSNNATMHSLNAGVYTKIGRVVTVTANVRTTSLGSVSGNLYLTGFPFASANTNGNHGAGSVANAENLNITAGHAISIYYSKNGSQARWDLYDSTGGITPLQGSEWSSDGQASIQITYSTA